MAILASDIAAQMRFQLDAEGSDYYTDARDIIPAINYSVRFVEAVINAALGQKKLGEESFRDISQARVFQTSIDSRITFDVFPQEVWTITGVFPLPETGLTGLVVPVPATNKNSILRNDKYHIRGEWAAKRLTIDEWTKNRNNPFEAGYDHAVVCDELREYGYLNPINYDPTGASSIFRELEIRPIVAQGLVTVFYIQKPTAVTTLSDFVPFPSSLFNLIVDKALFGIAYKQGDGTTMATITSADINQLLQTLN